MSFYDEMKQVAAEVLAEFAQGDVKYIHMVPGSGPADDPGPATPTLYPINSAVSGAAFRYVQSGLALKTDFQVTVAGNLPVVPDQRGFVTVDGVTHKIVGIDKKPSAGPVVAYILIIRK